MKIKLDKKGQVLGSFGNLAIGIAALTITLVVTFLILAQSNVQSASISGVTCSGVSGDYSCNSTRTLTGAVADIPGWVPLVIVAVVGAALLGLVALFRGQRS